MAKDNGIDDRYLGDGVYASFDGWHIVLDLRGQDPTTPITRIALEPAVFKGLIEFRTDVEKLLTTDDDDIEYDPGEIVTITKMTPEERAADAKRRNE